MLLKLAFLCLITVVAASKVNNLCPNDSSSCFQLGGRIIGGQTAHALQFPYAAAITTQTSNSKFFCGGSLLSNLWILTAGQCVYEAVLFQIFLGSTSLNSGSAYQVEVATSEYFLHPEYNPATLANDIGVIKLRLAVEFNDYLKPIGRLPLSEVPDFVVVSAFGWGQIGDFESGLSNELQWVVVTTLTNEECRLTYGNQISESMLCVEGNYNQGTCNGDTGGGLIQYYSTGHDVVVGVASFVSGNGCESTDPSGFTRVYPYNSWIRNVTGLEL